VRNGPEEVQICAVIDENDVILPGELDQGVAPVGEAFGKVLAGHVLELEDAAGFQVFFAQGGFAFDSGALVKVSVQVDEALGEGLRVVGIGVDDLIGVGGLRRRGERQAEC
jgi:hypothetical protein